MFIYECVSVSGQKLEWERLSSPEIYPKALHLALSHEAIAYEQ